MGYCQSPNAPCSGFQETLVGCSSPVWFPYVALDQLLAALDKVDGDESLCQVEDTLNELHLWWIAYILLSLTAGVFAPPHGRRLLSTSLPLQIRIVSYPALQVSGYEHNLFTFTVTRDSWSEVGRLSEHGIASLTGYGWFEMEAGQDTCHAGCTLREESLPDRRLTVGGIIIIS